MKATLIFDSKYIAAIIEAINDNEDERIKFFNRCTLLRTGKREERF